MKDLESLEELYETLRQDGPVLLCFRADWCGDCHYIQPALAGLEEEFSGRVRLVGLDIDEFPDAARFHDVSGIPSFILFHRSREIYRLVNSRRKTKEEVKDFLEKGLTLIHP